MITGSDISPSPHVVVIELFTEFHELLRFHLTGNEAQSEHLTDHDEYIHLITTAWERVGCAVRTAFASLQKRRNAWVPVNKLPMEILQRIFSFNRYNYETVLDISRTCWHWRRVSMQYPALWSIIGDYELNRIWMPLHVTNIFLDRSKKNTLEIDEHWWITHTETGVLDMLRNRPLRVWNAAANRIRRYSLNISNSVIPAGDLAWLETAPAPVLRTIFLRTRNYPAHVLDNLLIGKPEVRSLTLINIRLPWAPGQYANLTKLHITMMVSPRHPSDQSILNIFRDSPRIEDLLLHVERKMSHSLQDRHVYPLHCAKRVNLELVPADLYYILSSISLPEDLESLRLYRFGFGRRRTAIHCLPSGGWCPSILNANTLLVDIGEGQVQLLNPDTPHVSITLGAAGNPDGMRRIDCVGLRRLWEVRTEARTEARTCPAFAVVHIKGGYDSTLSKEISVTAETLQEIRSIATLTFEECYEELLDALEAMLGPHELDELQFKRMSLNSRTLLQLCAAKPTRIKRLTLDGCDLYCQTEEDAQLVVASIHRLNITVVCRKVEIRLVTHVSFP